MNIGIFKSERRLESDDNVYACRVLWQIKIQQQWHPLLVLFRWQWFGSMYLTGDRNFCTSHT